MTPQAAPRRPRHARRQRLVLADGRVIRLRPIDPADAGPIAAGFALLDEDEVRRRYLHPVKALGPDYLQALVAPDPRRGAAWVVAEPLPPGKALVGGVARIARTEAGDEADFAILVSHFVAGQGLGTALMRRLFEWARAQRIARLRGDVLDDNVAMLRLAQSLGFRREPGVGPGLVRIVADVRRRPGPDAPLR